VNLPEFAVKRPVTVVMIFTALIIFGLAAVRGIGIDLLPDITPPGVTVLVPYPGASASDVESDVIEYFEDTLSTVNNLEHIVSIAKDNVAAMTCQFAWGTNLDIAANDIRDRIELVKTELAEHAPDAREPFLFKFTSSMMPIMFISVGATESYKQLYHIADEDIVDPLRRVEGVGAVIMYGGLRRQINVEFDKQKLEAFNLPVNQVTETLAAENLDLPAGTVKMGRREYHLRVPGRFESVDEIRNVIIASRSGRPIYLRDIASVEDSFEEPKMYGWANGKEAIIMIVQKQAGTNTVAVARGIKRKLEEIKKTLPPDISFAMSMDASETIIFSIRNLGRTLLAAGFLVMAVTFVFLRRIPATLIIASILPLSMFVTLIFLYVMGYTINIISLMSLSVCLGMVVDNGIVVLENVIRRVEGGERPSEAVVFGASEVGTAIIASTLTTVVVFAPLIFVKGLTGVVFRQLGAVIAVTLGASLFASLTITPMLASRFVRRRTGLARLNGASEQADTTEGWYRSIETGYGNLLRLALRKRAAFLLVLLAIFVTTLGMARLIGTELFPEVDTGEISVRVQLDESTRVEKSADVALQLADLYVKHFPKETKSYFAFVGESEEQIGVAMGMAEGANVAEAGAKLVRKRERRVTTKQVADVLRHEARKVPGIQKLDISAGSPVRAILMGGTKPLSVEIQGYDLEKVSALANRLRDAVEKIPGAVDVTTTERLPRTEVWVDVDREKAAQLGVSTAVVARTVRANYFGYDATKYRDAGDDFDIHLRLSAGDRASLDEIGDITVPSITGNPIKLSNIAQVKLAQGPIWIDRKDRERVIKVEASTAAGYALGTIQAQVEREIQKLDVPPGITIGFGGQIEEQKKAFGQLRLLLAVGLLLVYMVMASQFESLKTPFVIMFSVPFAFTGAIWLLLITGSSISIIVLIGLVLLIGVVVNNAIVLVDYTNILRHRGMGMHEAIVTAGTRRLRPVLMTALTTIFSMVPLVLNTGEGSEMWQPFGITVIGGLSVSTIVTLVLVPVMYSIIARRIRGVAE